MKTFITSLQFIVGIGLIIFGVLGFVTPNEEPNYHALFTTPYSIAEIIIGSIMVIFLFDKQMEIQEMKLTESNLREQVSHLEKRLG